MRVFNCVIVFLAVFVISLDSQAQVQVKMPSYTSFMSQEGQRQSQDRGDLREKTAALALYEAQLLDLQVQIDAILAQYRQEEISADEARKKLRPLIEALTKIKESSEYKMELLMSESSL